MPNCGISAKKKKNSSHRRCYYSILTYIIDLKKKKEKLAFTCKNLDGKNILYKANVSLLITSIIRSLLPILHLTSTKKEE